MSQELDESKETEKQEEPEESRELFIARWKLILSEQEANTNRRIQTLSRLWQRNRQLGKKVDQQVLNAYLIELIQSATKDARDLYQQSFLVVEALEEILEWLDDVSGKVEGSTKQLAENLKGKIAPLVLGVLEDWKKRVKEESAKNSEPYVS